MYVFAISEVCAATIGAIVAWRHTVVSVIIWLIKGIAVLFPTRRATASKFWIVLNGIFVSTSHRSNTSAESIHAGLPSVC
jgi:hypothetical protein